VSGTNSVTDKQLKLMTLEGALAVVEGLTVDARLAAEGPVPMGDPAAHEFLMKLQHWVVRARGLCLNHAFPKPGNTP
jgi:hypothetical protein